MTTQPPNRLARNALEPSFSGDFGAFLWRSSDWEEIVEVLS